MWFLLVETRAMPTIFRRGDLVEWNSEAGRVRGVIIKKIISDIRIMCTTLRETNLNTSSQVIRAIMWRSTKGKH
jgi:hypothetical protein